MSEPSFDAFDMTWFAAWLALSAASRPASRIALRAFGLAAIAAAAAVRPAASISRLMAALAILSSVVLSEPPLLPLPRRVEVLAIIDASLSICPGQDGPVQKRFRY